MSLDKQNVPLFTGMPSQERRVPFPCGLFPPRCSDSTRQKKEEKGVLKLVFKLRSSRRRKCVCGGGGGATGKALGLIAAVFLAAVGGQIQEDAGLAEPGADSSLQLWAEADKDIRVAEYTLTDAGWERLELFMTLNIRRFLNFVEEEVRKDAEAEKTERCLELKWNRV